MRLRNQRGFSLLEVLIVLSVIAILAAIAIPLMKDALRRSQIRAGAADARTLFQAFKTYRVDHDMYPETAQLDTFDPLLAMGYIRRSGLTVRIVNDQADGYGSPDDLGINQEFWMEMTLNYDPTIRYLICDSDNSTLGGGDFYDGVVVFDNGVRMNL